MTLLDEARALLERGPYFYDYDNPNYFCACCGEEQLAPVVVHAPTCQWLAMPRIVAALERFEALAEAAAYLVELADTSARYGPLKHSVKVEARRRVNAALHPDYHVGKSGGLRTGMPYVNDAESGKDEPS